MSFDVSPPYGVIGRALKRGEVIPFLGAGASMCKRPNGQAWDVKASNFLPSGSELATCLARDAELPLQDAHELPDLAKVASFYIAQSNRRELLYRLKEVFDRRYETCEIHDFLAEVDAPLLIVTTNYDDLIEQAFRKRDRAFHLVVHATDLPENAGAVLWWKPGATEPEFPEPNSLDLFEASEPIIYKMHGSVSREREHFGSYVITEEDYVDFLSRMTANQNVIPKAFTMRFLYASFLFLGYSLSDWNLRVLLRNLKSQATGPAAGNRVTRLGGEPEQEERGYWAIQRDPTAVEGMLWQSRGVRIYNVELDEFVAKMRARMA